MTWNIPNQLTVARLVLSAVFFVLLGLYEPGTTGGEQLLNVAFVLYIIAGITDILDGYLARKWNQTSAFGRIVDPFCDKVLVVGAFVMLTGSNFAAGRIRLGEFEVGLPHWMGGDMASAVQAWMVVVILAREFIVSALRGYSESQGVKFPATYVGKIKMFVQSFAICTVLYQQANLPRTTWAVIFKLISVWAAVLVTAASGVAYVGRTTKLLKSQPEK
jgi:phosphatidylglycerophosphate synthase